MNIEYPYQVEADISAGSTTIRVVDTKYHQKRVLETGLREIIRKTNFEPYAKLARALGYNHTAEAMADNAFRLADIAIEDALSRPDGKSFCESGFIRVEIDLNTDEDYESAYSISFVDTF